MTRQRARAYAEVMAMLRVAGPDKLVDVERRQVREVADALVLCHTLADDVAASSALADLDDLHRRLAQSGRWAPHHAALFVHDIRSCGPPEVASATACHETSAAMAVAPSV
jgi:hypothetical protein